MLINFLGTPHQFAYNINQLRRDASTRRCENVRMAPGHMAELCTCSECTKTKNFEDAKLNCQNEDEHELELSFDS